MNDLFWLPQAGEHVTLKPAAAAMWPFEVERDKPFLVVQCNPVQQTCWITPADKQRRWHSSLILMSELVPTSNDKAKLGDQA